MVLAYSSVANVQLRLPAGDNSSSLLYVAVRIRDRFNCITEYNLSTVVVRPDLQAINNFIGSIQNSSNTITSDPMVQILASGNQNSISQIIQSLAQAFNQVNNQTIKNILASKYIRYNFYFFLLLNIFLLDGIPIHNIVVSTLSSSTQQVVSCNLFLNTKYSIQTSCGFFRILYKYSKIFQFFDRASLIIYPQ